MRFIFILLLLLPASTGHGYVHSVVVTQPPYFTISRGLPFRLHRQIVAEGILHKEDVEQQAHRFGFPNFATLFRYAAFDGYADVVEQLANIGGDELTADDVNDALVALVNRDAHRLLAGIDGLHETSTQLNLHSISSHGETTAHVYVRESRNRRIDSRVRHYGTLNQEKNPIK